MAESNAAKEINMEAEFNDLIQEGADVLGNFKKWTLLFLFFMLILRFKSIRNADNVITWWTGYNSRF